MQDPKYKLSFKSPFKRYWDAGVLGLAIFNSLMIPFEQAFHPEFANYQSYARFNDFVDFTFLFDVILMFFTSVSYNGRETFEPD